MRNVDPEESFRTALRDAVRRELPPNVKEILALLGLPRKEEDSRPLIPLRILA
jgi:hypothetical protein